MPTLREGAIPQMGCFSDRIWVLHRLAVNEASHTFVAAIVTTSYSTETALKCSWTRRSTLSTPPRSISASPHCHTGSSSRISRKDTLPTKASVGGATVPIATNKTIFEFLAKKPQSEI